jgi:hypothetical protein
MTNSTVDRLVDDYLARLADAAQALPADRCADLLSEIREHIVASRAEGDGADESAVRTMLDRLGEPADIVAAAVEDDPPEHAAYPERPQARRPGIGLEIGAVVMLTLGSLIPVIGWAVGVILLWSSGLWRRSEKVLGTLIFPGGPGLALVLGGATGFALTDRPCSISVGPAIGGQPMTPVEVCTGSALPPVLGIAVLLLVLIAPVVVAIVLLGRARGRARLEDR